MATVTLSESYRQAKLRITYNETYDATNNETTLQVTSVALYNNTITVSGFNVIGEIVCNEQVVARFVGWGTNKVNFKVDTWNNITNGEYPAIVLKHDLDGALSLAFHTQTYTGAEYPNYGGDKKGVYCYALSNGSYLNQTFYPSTTVSADATGKGETYTLTLDAGDNTTLTVNRTSSPWGGSTGALSNGATLYYSDKLTVSFSAPTGYEVTTHTINGVSFASGDSHTVTGNVVVVTEAGAMGLVYIDTGTELKKYLIFIDNGITWVQYIPFVDDGTEWIMCS